MFCVVAVSSISACISRDPFIMPNLASFLEEINQSKLSTETKSLMQLFVKFIEESEAEKKQEIAALKETIKSQEDRIIALENKEDKSNQYSRLDSITISPKRNENGSFIQGTVPTLTPKTENKLYASYLKITSTLK